MCVPSETAEVDTEGMSASAGWGPSPAEEDTTLAPLSMWITTPPHPGLPSATLEAVGKDKGEHTGSPCWQAQASLNQQPLCLDRFFICNTEHEGVGRNWTDLSFADSLSNACNGQVSARERPELHPSLPRGCQGSQDLNQAAV